MSTGQSRWTAGHSELCRCDCRKHGDGLFVTTAKFSQQAKDYANTHHIILIDGERLANLMIEYDFCVSTRKTFEIKEIDTDALAEYQDE